MTAFLTILIHMWITPPAFGWGAVGHRIITENGASLAGEAALKNCHVTAAALVQHTTDPDNVWRQKRIQYPHEWQAHFFHVDRQPKEWKTLRSAKVARDGNLVYRIVDWTEEARKLRQQGKWAELAERLYGLTHYLGDLTQPLHAHHDYDGEAAGLPGIHSQFETKMVGRFEGEIRAGMKTRLAEEKIPDLWKSLEFRNLVFDVAQQSSAKVPLLFEGARPAYKLPAVSKKRRKPLKARQRPQFIKAELWKGTGKLAVDQMALGARLVGHALTSICR